MPSIPDTARQCFALAVAAAPAMVGRAIEQAVAALQQEEHRCTSVAQRQDLADAWLELSRRRADWMQRFPLLLQSVQARPANDKPAPAAAAADRFGGLALVDEDALAREIDSARLLQLLAPPLEQALAELDGLMSSALGLATVQPERNPLRPQVFAQALRELMQPIPQPGWARLWAQQLAAPLALDIQNVYREALKLLQAARLTAATYRVLPTAASPTRPAVAAPAPAAAAVSATGAAVGTSSGAAAGAQPPARAGAAGTGHAAAAAGHAGAAGNAAAASNASSGAGAGSASAQAAGLGTTGPLGGASWADLSGHALADELFQNFLFSRAQPSAQPLAPAYYARVDAQLASVAAATDRFEAFDAEAAVQHRGLPPVERPHRPVGTERGLDDAVWGRWAAAQERALHRVRLKKEARQVGQVLGLEVVRKLVDQVALDPRLLAPVREAVVALEPALARLALVAPRFFAQEDHAGRRIVERVAERSFRYNDEFASDFHEFFSGVRSVFQALNEREDVHDDAPFAQALGTLEERWAGEDALEQHGRQVAVDAMHFAEAREAEAAQIAWHLSQRSDLEGVPAVVQDFLFGPWSQVMAHARLTDTQHQVDPGGWNAVITDLLWSVKSEQTLREPGRLISTIPGMLERLRNGMKLVGQEPAEQESFFGALETLHRPVLKLRARTRTSAIRPPDPVPQVDPALMSTQRQQPRARSGTPWLTPSELQAAGFDEEHPSAPAPLEAQAAAESEVAPDLAAIVGGLHQGCWVDLHVRGAWRRASLTWVSARATLFMFVSHGGQPHSMTRRSLERLVRDRLLRPVEAGAVVPRAIEALSQQPAAPAASPRKPLRLASEERVAA